MSSKQCQLYSIDSLLVNTVPIVRIVVIELQIIVIAI